MPEGSEDPFPNDAVPELVPELLPDLVPELVPKLVPKRHILETKTDSETDFSSF